MSPASTPHIRVVVRLPYNRPDEPVNDPQRIEWTPEKADILWKVIERSRTSDNAGTDWKGLAAHLDVPLPYLLYRVHARFQEELRGLQGIQDALSPKLEEFPFASETPLSPLANRSTASRLTSPTGRSPTSTFAPMGIRARLNSLGKNSRQFKKATSSSTLTVQDAPAITRRAPLSARPRSASPSSSEDGTDSDEEKEAEADKAAEEQETLDRKLQELQNMMTRDALGLVSSENKKGKSKALDRGRSVPSLSHRSQSLSSHTSSLQGSIPDMASPPGPHSPMQRALSPTKSSSPPALSSKSAVGHHSHRGRVSHLGARSPSDHSSNVSSQASSFSDLSDASLSGSAFDSAVLSKATNSRFSAFTSARTRFRPGTTPH